MYHNNIEENTSSSYTYLFEVALTLLLVVMPFCTQKVVVFPITSLCCYIFSPILKEQCQEFPFFNLFFILSKSFYMRCHCHQSTQYLWCFYIWTASNTSFHIDTHPTITTNNLNCNIQIARSYQIQWHVYN